jgi:hypothetical protein
VELAQFLLARIADDELVALAATLDEESYGPLGNFTGVTTDARLAHAARWSASRVRQEAVIRRQLVDLHDPGARTCCQPRENPGPCPTLRLIGLAYAEHPDYRQHWRP